MLIVASAGINTAKRKNLAKVILAGTDIIRVNISRHSIEQNLRLITDVKNTIEQLNANTKIMLDLPLYKYRLGDFEDKQLDVKEYEELIMRTGNFSPSIHEFVPVMVEELGKAVQLNQVITIGDGEIAVQIIEIINNETVKVRVLNNGPLVYYKTFNIPTDYSDIYKDDIIRLYEEMLQKIAVHEPNFVVIPYLNKDINERIKSLAAWGNENFDKTRLIVRMETAESIKNAEAVLTDRAYSMALLDRGEMGTNLPFEQLGITQNRIIALAHKHKKPLLISTQILESTMNNYIPSRAEISDLTNLITQGVAGIVFRRETGFNSRPAYTVSVAKKIIKAAQEYIEKTDHKTP